MADMDWGSPGSENPNMAEPASHDEASDEYGQRLWDRFDVVAARTECCVRLTKKLSSFLKKRASIEETYAKDLAKLAKTTASTSFPKYACVGGTTLDAYKAAIDSVAAASEIHAKLAQKLNLELSKPLEQFFKAVDPRRKQVLQRGVKQTAELQQALALAQKTKDLYLRSVRDHGTVTAELERARASSNTKPQAITKLESKEATLASKEGTAKRDWSRAVAAANDTQEKFVTLDIVDTLNACQALDVEAAETTRNFVRDYASDVSGSLSTVVLEAARPVAAAAEAIDITSDCRMFLASTCTGAAYPPAIVGPDTPPPRPTQSPPSAPSARTSTAAATAAMAAAVAAGDVAPTVSLDDVPDASASSSGNSLRRVESTVGGQRAADTAAHTLQSTGGGGGSGVSSIPQPSLPPAPPAPPAVTADVAMGLAKAASVGAATAGAATGALAGMVSWAAQSSPPDAYVAGNVAVGGGLAGAGASGAADSIVSVDEGGIAMTLNADMDITLCAIELLATTWLKQDAIGGASNGDGAVGELPWLLERVFPSRLGLSRSRARPTLSRSQEWVAICTKGENTNTTKNVPWQIAWACHTASSAGERTTFASGESYVDWRRRQVRSGVAAAVWTVHRNEDAERARAALDALAPLVSAVEGIAADPETNWGADRTALASLAAEIGSWCPGLDSTQPLSPPPSLAFAMYTTLAGSVFPEAEGLEEPADSLVACEEETELLQSLLPLWATVGITPTTHIGALAAAAATQWLKVPHPYALHALGQRVGDLTVMMSPSASTPPPPPPTENEAMSLLTGLRPLAVALRTALSDVCSSRPRLIRPPPNAGNGDDWTWDGEAVSMTAEVYGSVYEAMRSCAAVVSPSDSNSVAAAMTELHDGRRAWQPPQSDLDQCFRSSAAVMLRRCVAAQDIPAELRGAATQLEDGGGTKKPDPIIASGLLAAALAETLGAPLIKGRVAAIVNAGCDGAVSALSKGAIAVFEPCLARALADPNVLGNGGHTISTDGVELVRSVMKLHAALSGLGASAECTAPLVDRVLPIITLYVRALAPSVDSTVRRAVSADPFDDSCGETVLHSSSAVDVAACFHQTVTSYLSVGFPQHDSLGLALADIIVQGMTTYADILSRETQQLDAIVPPLPGERQNPRSTAHGGGRLTTSTLAGLCLRLNGAVLLKERCGHLAREIAVGFDNEAAAAGAATGGDGPNDGTTADPVFATEYGRAILSRFSSASKQLDACIQALAVYTGAKVIWVDLDDELLSQLYTPPIQQHRLDAVLTGSMNEVMGALCELLAGEHLDLVLVSVLAAFTRVLSRVLLDGGSARLWTPQDADVITEDLHVAEEFFNNGMEPSVVSKALGGLFTVVGSVMELSSEDLIDLFPSAPPTASRPSVASAALGGGVSLPQSQGAVTQEMILKVLKQRGDPAATAFASKMRR